MAEGTNQGIESQILSTATFMAYITPVFNYLSSSLPLLTEFGSAVDERTRNNLYVREVLGLYIFCFAKI